MGSQFVFFETVYIKFASPGQSLRVFHGLGLATDINISVDRSDAAH